MTDTILTTTFMLTLALGAVLAGLWFHLWVFGRRLVETVELVHLARRGLALADDVAEKALWRAELVTLETEALVLRERIRRWERWG